MRKIVSSLSITADGYCDHTTTIADDEHQRQSIDLMDQSDIIVLGRVTYALFESFWPGAKHDTTLPASTVELAQKINLKRKVVISKTLSHADWENSVVISDLRQLLLLKQQPGKDIVIFGSPGLVSALSKRNMIDEYHFSVQPVIAGKGKRLFAEIAPDERLNLILNTAKTFKSGVTTLFFSAPRK